MVAGLIGFGMGVSATCLASWLLWRITWAICSPAFDARIATEHQRMDALLERQDAGLRA